jgi:hypothetical protein
MIIGKRKEVRESIDRKKIEKLKKIIRKKKE